MELAARLCLGGKKGWVIGAVHGHSATCPLSPFFLWMKPDATLSRVAGGTAKEGEGNMPPHGTLGHLYPLTAPRYDTAASEVCTRQSKWTQPNGTCLSERKLRQWSLGWEQSCYSFLHLWNARRSGSATPWGSHEGDEQHLIAEHQFNNLDWLCEYSQIMQKRCQETPFHSLSICDLATPMC